LSDKLFEVVMYTVNLACNTLPPPFNESVYACIYA